MVDIDRLERSRRSRPLSTIGLRPLGRGLGYCALALALAGCVGGNRPSFTPTQAQQDQGVRLETARDFYDRGRAYETGDGVPLDVARAVELYEEAQRRGEPRASERLAILSARGEVDLAPERTRDLLVLSTLRGSDSAQLELARLELTGGGGRPRDIARAIELLEALASQNNTSALVDLGVIYLDPQYGRVDRVRGMELLERAHVRGNASASVNLARLYSEPGSAYANRARAIEYAGYAIDRGDARGHVVLGRIASDPGAPGYDPAAAESAFMQANAAGSSEAREDLADLYATTGRIDEALAIYRQLIDAGQPDLAYDAGAILADGPDGRRGEAYAYLEAAYAAGRDAAPRRILNLFEDGVTDPDGNRAPALAIVIAWADLLGDPEVYYRVGRVLESGGRDIANVQQAIRYYQLAANGGRGDAADRLARLVGGGAGPQSVAALQQAAQSGDAGALYDLGRIQEEGGDYEAAANSYLRAAQAGNASAAVRLSKLVEERPNLADTATLIGVLDRAAATGNSEARLELATLLIGQGGADNMARARNLLVQASNQGEARAFRILGDLAMDNASGPSTAEAMTYYEQAVRAGDGRSAFRLLRTVARFSDDPARLQTALSLTQPTVSGGDAVAAYWYGVVLIELRRSAEAVPYLLEAHSQGVRGAFEELRDLAAADASLAAIIQPQLELNLAGTSNVCESGRLALIQAEEASRDGGDSAVTLYREALDAGWYLAAERLGGIYLSGLAAARPDFQSAYAYYAIAADAGIIGARDRLNNVSSALTDAQRAEAQDLLDSLLGRLPAACSESQ